MAIGLRGFGASSPPREPYTSDAFDFGVDVIAAVKWLEDKRLLTSPPILVGHSLGGGAILRAIAAGANVKGGIVVL